MIKIIGAILIFLTCVGISQKRISTYRNSSKTLTSIINGLRAMADNISFLKKPLPEIIEDLKEREDDVFFRLVSDAISKYDNITMEKAWETAIKNESISICPKAKETLITLAKTLGKQSASQEEENISHCLNSLQDILKSEDELCKKNIKMIKSVGILTGLMIVILFV